MSDHLVVFVDRLIRPAAVQSAAESSEIAGSGPVGGGADGGPGLAPVPAPNAAGPGPSSSATDEKEDEGLGEEEPLIQTAECRICQEEDSLKDLETPCACSGSLKYAHRKCVQHWCNEKGDTICEICHQPYQPGYTAPPPSPPDETAIDIGGGWTISGTPLELDPRLLAIAEAERHFLEAEYDDYAASSASGAAYCRSVALILMALLLLRHALGISDADADTDDETSAFFSLFLLRAAGFLLPCYIMAWAISMLQRRRQRQEAAALAATQVAFVLQSGQRRGLQFAIASGRAAAVPAPVPAPSGPAPTVASPQEAV